MGQIMTQGQTEWLEEHNGILTTPFREKKLHQCARGLCKTPDLL